MPDQERNQPSRPNNLRSLPKPVKSVPAKRKKTTSSTQTRNKPEPDYIRQPASSNLRPEDHTLWQAIRIFLNRKLKKSNPSRRQMNTASRTKLLGAVSLGLVCISLFVLILWSVTNKNAFAITLDDKELGYIAKAKDVDETAMQLQAVTKLASSLGASVQVNETIVVKPAHSARKNLQPYPDMIDLISRSFTYKIEATAIMVEGREIAVLKTKNEALSVEKQLQAPFVNDNANIKAEFVEDWALVTKLVDQEELQTVEYALTQLDKKTRTMQDYTIQKGDMLGTIAVRNNTTVDKICADNPGMTASTVLKVGQVIQMEVTKPYLSVKTQEEIIRKETIPMTVRQEENPMELKSYSKVIQEGHDGEQEVTVRITRINGVQTEPEQIINTKPTLDPQDQITEVGTSEITPQRR